MAWEKRLKICVKNLIEGNVADKATGSDSWVLMYEIQAQ